MQTLTLQHGDAFAEFSLFGGQLLRWRAGGRERLFMSPRAVLDGHAAIRGGVPVIFPQFNARGPYARHGFARTQPWRLREQADDRLLLELTDSEATRALWPHRFALHLEARLAADTMVLTLDIENRDAFGMEFCCALHTYFACTLGQTRVLGLADCSFEEGGDWHPASRQEALMPSPPLDRIYRGRSPTLLLQDDGGTLSIEAEGFADWVVWNPGEAGAAALADLGTGCSGAFLCIEPGAIFEPIRLASGERWAGVLRLRVLG
ncbi:D-hexose-6-phosphate mutarotase [Aquimonas voraii]|uniref:glucose-6-phosphate 1-epimerase n=1 Tax=Aquimonas voraii TaxID=265719 RepID=A0A1G6YPQ1_9GAMM|nr:D-hexose-6-phosphate mutarotase [Aquimonas voraii]SDD92003.1 glucose-6-phosphate 1-epimerase [Aquimonas voraii]